MIKFKKLDGRYKAVKVGLSRDMIEMDINHWHAVEKIVHAAYGKGYRAYEERLDVAACLHHDWFYTYTVIEFPLEMVTHKGRLGTVMGSKNVVRLYFRREEQANYMALKLANLDLDDMDVGVFR